MTIRTTFILLVTTLIILCSACKQFGQNIKVITGDLYFSAIRYSSFYNQPDSLIKVFKSYADTANSNEKDILFGDLLTKYAVLKKENLLYNPYVELRLPDEAIVNLYFDTFDYNKIKVYRREDLQNSHKKIRIEANSKDLGSGVLFCVQLVSVDKVDGETLQEEKKLKIEDYR